jgi:hypothetical protein
LTSALDGGKWSASRPCRFTPGEIAPDTHWIKRWVGPRVGLDVVVKIVHCRESNPGRPARSPSLYRLLKIINVLNKTMGYSRADNWKERGRKRSLLILIKPMQLHYLYATANPVIFLEELRISVGEDRWYSGSIFGPSTSRIRFICSVKDLETELNSEEKFNNFSFPYLIVLIVTTKEILQTNSKLDYKQCETCQT